MGKHIKWVGFGIRTVKHYRWESGDVLFVKEDDLADRILLEVAEENNTFSEVKKTSKKKKKEVKSDAVPSTGKVGTGKEEGEVGTEETT